ncbi:hypothetical protein K4F52_008966 [Lecanicillium sp. MT-2017a]|nr:hypothetical protein K4F52_008966 [Lecanicillium sp. MT-2017a]
MPPKKPKRRVFPVTTFVTDLPESLVPKPQPTLSKTAAPEPKRLIIVGDVHGMKEALEKLLDDVKFDRDNGDHLILVGDVVNKGTDNPGVVDLAIKLQASAVRGNHDNAVLDAAAETRFKNGKWTEATGQNPVKERCLEDATQPTDSQETRPVRPPTPEAEPHSSVTVSTAASLSVPQLEWLASLPLILRVNVPGHGASPPTKLVVVHAGLVPGVPLEEQDEHAVMHLRSLERSGSHSGALLPTQEDGEEGWAVTWEQAQEQLPECERTMVVFGHDARRKLQERKYSIGLDTGCVYGNQLSALVVSVTEQRLNYRIVQVESTKPGGQSVPEPRAGEEQLHQIQAQESQEPEQLQEKLALPQEK